MGGLKQALETIVQAVGKNHPDFVQMMTSFGRTQFANGNIEDAESTLSEALAIQKQIMPGANANTVWTLINLGQVLKHQERFEEAQKIFSEAVEIASVALPPDHWRNLTARLQLADCQIKTGQATAPRDEIAKILNELEGRTDFHATRLQARAKNIGI